MNGEGRGETCILVLHWKLKQTLGLDLRLHSRGVSSPQPFLAPGWSLSIKLGTSSRGMVLPPKPPLPLSWADPPHQAAAGKIVGWIQRQAARNDMHLKLDNRILRLQDNEVTIHHTWNVEGTSLDGENLAKTMPSSPGSDVFAVFALLFISAFVLLLLRYYLPLRTTPASLTVPIFLALALPISIILLVPIDLASTSATEDGDLRGIWLPQGLLLVVWRLTYWLTFALTWYDTA